MPRARSKPRDVYHHGDLRDAILEVASAVVGKDGPDELTVRLVAQRLAVSHPAIYHHFNDRAELLAAVAERGFDRLIAAMDAAMAEADSALLRYRQQGLSYLQFAVRNPRLYGLMLSTRRQHPSLAAASDRVLDRIRVAVKACQKDGVLVEGSPDEHALFCWSAVHGLASLVTERQLQDLELPDSFQAIAEIVVDRIFTGLGARPET